MDQRARQRLGTAILMRATNTVSLWEYVCLKVPTRSERQAFWGEWVSHFAFPTTAVPTNRVEAATRLIDAWTAKRHKAEAPAKKHPVVVYI